MNISPATATEENHPTRKLKLDAEALCVETFRAEAARAVERGTVRARGETDTSCPHTGFPCHETHYNWYTCGGSCVYECRLTGCMPTCEM